MTELVVYAFASAGILGLLLMWARCYALDAHAAADILSEGYEAAQKLIKDDSTPESVVRFAEFFAGQMGRPHLARGFAWHLLTGRKSHTSERAKIFADELEKLNQKSMDSFAQMVSAGMVSSAASDPLLSRVYLNAIGIFLSKSGNKDGSVSPERARTVAVDVVDSDFADCLPQAA